MAKTILILYTAHHAPLDVPFSDKKYQRCYEALYTIGESMGLHLCRAPLTWYNEKDNRFDRTWEFSHGQWKISGPVVPDLVLDRTRGYSDTDPIRRLIAHRFLFIHDPAFTRLANDKYGVARLLPQYFKPYQKVETVTELQEAISTIPGDMIVIKPNVGSGGEGVHILNKADISKIDIHYPAIIQEFIDNSKGVPGLSCTYHDLRLMFIDDELTYSYIRTPRPGSLLANIAQGGSMDFVPKEKIPSSLQPIIDATRELFSIFPDKLYTIDTIFDETGKPWIVEFNSMPGMFFPEEEKVLMQEVYTKFLNKLKNILDRPPKKDMLTTVIISSPSDKALYQAFQSDTYRLAYTAFAIEAAQQGVQLYRAPINWYEQDYQTFQSAWYWDGRSWVLQANVTPQVIYDKATHTPQSLVIKRALEQLFPLVNPIDFSLHAGSKLYTTQTFSNYTKPLHLAQDHIELETITHSIPGEKIVLKPDRGNSGEGIFIYTKGETLPKEITFPIFAQEFIDSSAGIPGVMQGLHDLRLIFSQEQLIYSYYRTPRKGSFLANLAQGGTQTMVEKNDIPASIWKVVELVQAYYSNFSEKIYTIDFMFDKTGKPWIIELNTMPGLYPDESERPYIQKLYRAIIDTLKRAAVKRT